LAVAKWLRHGLKVKNKEKRTLPFYNHDTAPVSMRLGNNEIKSSKNINVLGVISIPN
jgi:hypothetical protein